MIACPSCGHDTVVTETRRSAIGSRRRRRCPKCQTRFSTMETVLGAWRHRGHATLVSTKSLRKMKALIEHALVPEEKT